MLNLDDIRSLKDPLVSYSYSVEFPSEIKLDANRVISVSLPFASNSPESMFYYGQNIYNADIKNMSAMTIQFVEDQNGGVVKGLEQWRDMIVDTKGNYGYPEDYKKEITVSLLNNNRTPVLVCRLIGCFPSVKSPISVSSDSSNAVTVSQEFSCDDIELLNKVGGSSVLQNISSDSSWNISELGLSLPKSITSITSNEGFSSTISSITNSASQIISGSPVIKVSDKGLGLGLPGVKLPNVPTINIPGMTGVSSTLNKVIKKVSNKINTKINKVQTKVSKKLPKINTNF